MGVEHPLRLSLTLRQSETGQSCPAGDRGDGGDSRFGIPPPLSPFGRTPRKRGVQAWAFPASFGASSHPCGQKNRPRFFRPAFTGCNTLHLASKVVCQRGTNPPFGNPWFCRRVATVRIPAPVSPPLQNPKKRRRPAHL